MLFHKSTFGSFHDLDREKNDARIKKQKERNLKRQSYFTIKIDTCFAYWSSSV